VISRGFSLLEALVTLVIIALVTTLLMQSLVYVLGMRERLLRYDQQARSSALYERWFRDTVLAAQGDLPEGIAPFKGDEEGVSFLSADALKRGGLAPVAWRVVREQGVTRMLYTEDGQSWPIALPPFSTARFDFLDAQGKWHSSWPQESLPRQVLPRAVRLVTSVDAQEQMWIAVVAAGPDLPRVLQPDMRSLDVGF